MDLEPNNQSFYFIYEYSIDRDLFKKSLDNYYDKLSSRIKIYNKNEDEKAERGKRNDINKVLSLIYRDSLKEKTFYSDSSYNNIQHIDLSIFKTLFNYSNIFANRVLDDANTDKNKLLSKNMVAIASTDENWDQSISELPDKILQLIQSGNIEEIIINNSLGPLETLIKTISNADGGHMGLLSLDLDISDDAIKKFIISLIGAKYQLGDCQLGESSQGLGYSNLIYIFLQIEKYKKSIDPLKVNFFIIEEPEAHMHPQMQTVFITELFNYYKESNNTIQCLITTHSSEVVRGAKAISKLRVLRRFNQFTCSLFDLKKFHDSIANNKDLIEFYDFFFTINFPDIIFADKALMYEGDTERMYIRTLLSLPDFQSLQQQYIAFVQVGGAYAFKYKDLLEFLKIKTIILTDLDYDKSACDKDAILKSKTTNTTINVFAKQALKLESPTIANLYEWKNSMDQFEERKIIIDNLIYLAFQGQDDHYSRTLEEAMLSKFYKCDTFDKKEQKIWKDNKEKHKLKYSIPNEDWSSIRDIVKSTSQNKADLMYSVLLENKHEEMLPNYIKEALEWLAK